MSVSYNRVNWADYPATTTPVNATNLNKMDKGIADLTSEINDVESDVSDLNNRLDDIDIRYNSTSGKPEWRERGAGSFVPFDASVVKGFYMQKTESGTPYCYILNTDGNTYKVNWLNGMSVCDFASVSPNPSTYYAHNCTAKKDGFYLCQSDGLVYRTVGQVINPTSHMAYCYYFGEANPFE